MRFRRIGLIVLAVALNSCAIGGFVADRPDPATSRVVVSLTDDAGSPVEQATFISTDGTTTDTSDGTLNLDVDQPIAGIVRSEGMLDEPVVVDGTTTELTVTLWRAFAEDGTRRFAAHFAGDTMMGRRYLEPTRRGTAAVSIGDDGASAEAVVAAVAPVFAAADLSVLNLETVIGRAPLDEAMAGKRYLLQSPPEIIGALNALGVDVALLGNNHAADWGVRGIAGTVTHLADAGISSTGAGSNDEEARTPAWVQIGGTELAVLSYTTVTGSAVNDALPTTQESDRPASDGWQTEPRSFSYDRFGVHIQGTLLAGDVWRWFETLDLDPAAESDVWGAITTTFPEVQDWVARRGHGGAAWFQKAVVERDIAAARADGADVVIVQIHGGYQFADVGSTFFVESAHAAVDAGADLVVGHHPHVLQGFEWYDGTLIAHSLGNFVFDQDFSSTFSSVILRTIFEGDSIISATVLPVLIVDYRPAMAAGEAAQAILREIRADSTGTAPAEKIGDTVARNVDASQAGSADLAITGNSATIVERLPTRTEVVELGQDGTADVPGGILVLSDAVPSTVAIGRDLLRWGSFDDVTSDGSTIGGAQWALDDSRRTELALVDPASHSLAIRMEPSRTSSALVRPVARVSIPPHRFMDGSGAPADGDADYAIRATVRTTGPMIPVVRMDLYAFDDSDPLTDPESDLVGRVEIPLAVAGDNEDWVTIEALVPAGTFAPRQGVTPNAVMIYLQLDSGTPSTVEIDDLQLVEWRRAADLPAGVWVEADVIRSTEPSVTLTVR